MPLAFIAKGLQTTPKRRLNAVMNLTGQIHNSSLLQAYADKRK